MMVFFQESNDYKSQEHARGFQGVSTVTVGSRGTFPLNHYFVHTPSRRHFALSLFLGEDL